MGEKNLAPLPVALYGTVLLMAGCAYAILSRALIACDGAQSALGQALGKDRRAMIGLVLYAVAIPLSFASARAPLALYVLVAALWFVPDRRIEPMLIA